MMTLKFAPQVLLLVCASVTFVQGEKQTAIWQDLIVHDCNKGLHMFPSSPMGGSMDGTTLMTALDFGLKEVKKRIKCTDPAKATKAHALCNYIPSIEMVMYNMMQNYHETDHTETSETYDGFPRYGFFDKNFPVLRDLQKMGNALMAGLIPNGVRLSIASLVPDTCKVMDFISGKPCNMEVDLSAALGKLNHLNPCRRLKCDISY